LDESVIPWRHFLGGMPPSGRRIARPGWLLFDLQDANLRSCAVHALNHILQGEFPWFSMADLQEGAQLATLADHEADLTMPFAHSDVTGYFSSEAVGRAIGRRYFEWRGVRVHSTPQNNPDPHATVEAAFRPAILRTGAAAVLGIFVHQGAHYTAIIRRHGQLYHIDSMPGASDHGRSIFQIDPILFLSFVQYFRQGRQAPESRQIGGLFSIYYTGEAAS
jgi:hypothetical protein